MACYPHRPKSRIVSWVEHEHPFPSCCLRRRMKNRIVVSQVSFLPCPRRPTKNHIALAAEGCQKLGVSSSCYYSVKKKKKKAKEGVI